MAHAVVVMGAGGAPTALGQHLALRLGFDYANGDAYQPRANLEKLAAGAPLTDADLDAWLHRLRRLVEAQGEEGRSIVLACTSLRARGRQALAGAEPAVRVHFVLLRAGVGEDAGDAAGDRPASEPAFHVVLDAALDRDALVLQAEAALAARGVLGLS